MNNNRYCIIMARRRRQPFLADQPPFDTEQFLDILGTGKSFIKHLNSSPNHKIYKNKCGI